ncbi:ABC transporter permease [Calditrichota bacterium]
MFFIFSLFALFVACLGLFGLSSFAAERKKKEIGIRKVFGATIRSITLKFSSEFSRLVILANLIAWPVAWYSMNYWLQNFAYKTEIEWWIFLLAGSIALLIAVITVSSQAIKAAIANPVKSLKYE